jgi:hypothetical protein
MRGPLMVVRPSSYLLNLGDKFVLNFVEILRNRKRDEANPLVEFYIPCYLIKKALK